MTPNSSTDSAIRDGRPTENAIDKLGAAIETALKEAPTADVLSILVASMVGLTVELARRQGVDESREIKIDGGNQRDVTIHARKG